MGSQRVMFIFTVEEDITHKPQQLELTKTQGDGGRKLVPLFAHPNRFSTSDGPARHVDSVRAPARQ